MKSPRPRPRPQAKLSSAPAHGSTLPRYIQPKCQLHNRIQEGGLGEEGSALTMRRNRTRRWQACAPFWPRVLWCCCLGSVDLAWRRGWRRRKPGRTVFFSFPFWSRTPSYHLPTASRRKSGLLRLRMSLPGQFRNILGLL
jgi:hypothetical protein